MTHMFEKGQTRMRMMKPLYRMEASHGADGGESARQMTSCRSDCHKAVWEDSCGVFMRRRWESKRSA